MSTTTPEALAAASAQLLRLRPKRGDRKCLAGQTDDVGLRIRTEKPSFRLSILREHAGTLY